MTHCSPRRAALACPLLVAALLAGCSHPRPAPLPPPAPAPVLDRQAELNGAVALLDQGDTATASARVNALLARDPADPQARVLRESIDKDPVALLGPKNFPYTVKPGETMLGLAERFLGNRLKSYQLARYNGIAVPASLTAGTVLKIPGTAPRAEPEARTPARTRPGRGKPAEAGSTSTPAASATPAAVPHVDAAGARAARAAGLAALAQGDVGRAIGLLRRAAQLNPGDPLIARDYARAQRIAATVKARR
jgi:hypothetical protein